MAIVPIHKQVTKTVLAEFGFSENMQEAAARANAAVDEKQNNIATETNLHAMRGYVGSGIQSRMQTTPETRVAVRALLKKAEADIMRAIREGSRERAVLLIGAALHTIQDREIHHYEPWPYEGIANAVTLDPGYMIMHGVRDLCLIRYVSGGYAATPQAGALTMETGLRLPVSTPVSMGLRGTYRQHYGGRPEWIGLLSVCIGDCHQGRPATRRAIDPPVPLGSAHASPSLAQPLWTYRIRVKPQELQQATEQSRSFVRRLQNAAGPSDWRRLIGH